MKYSNKTMIFFLFMLASFGVDVSAYTYTIANFTGRDVTVQLHQALSFVDKGKLTKKDVLIEAYDTKVLSFGKGQALLCLTKIWVTSFDEKKGKYTTLPAPMKFVDDEYYEAVGSAITAFGDAVNKGVEGIKQLGPKGKVAAAVIAGLTDAVEASKGLFDVSLCRGRDFMLIVDYDPVIKSDRVYALVSPGI